MYCKWWHLTAKLNINPELPSATMDKANQDKKIYGFARAIACHPRQTWRHPWTEGLAGVCSVPELPDASARNF
jgi:hypothetical protein